MSNLTFSPWMPPVRAADPDDVWERCPLGDLVAHVVAVHHERERAELTRLQTMASDLTRTHGLRHPEMLEVQAMLVSLANELEPHMLREEMVLFPYIRDLEAGDVAPNAAFGTVTHPLRALAGDHQVVTGILDRLRALTEDFAAPIDAGFACDTFYGALADFERGLQRHLQLEERVLFPRAVRLEAKRADGEQDL